MNRFDITEAQNKAWSILARSHCAGRVASTYLFYGREGLGDWSLAVEFAALLNCHQPVVIGEQPKIQHPCHECQPCKAITALNFEGLQFVLPIPKHKNSDEAIDLTNEVLQRKREEPFRLLNRSKPTTIPIDLAREVKKRLALKTVSGVTRVVVFHQMDRMRTSSADSLLKLIEEPPPDTVIILTALKPEVLLPTIQSRAQKIRLERIAESHIVTYLQQGYKLTESRARLIARLSEGSLGAAIELAGEDDGDSSGLRAVGLLLFKTLCTGPGPELVSQLLDMVPLSDRGAVEELLRLWQSLIRDCAWYATTGEEANLTNIDFIPETRKLSPGFTRAEAVERMVNTIKNTLADLSRTVHIPAALIAMALKLKAEIADPGMNPTTENISG